MLRAGTGQIDVSRMSTDIRDPLRATALYLDDEENQTISIVRVKHSAGKMEMFR